MSSRFREDEDVRIENQSNMTVEFHNQSLLSNCTEHDAVSSYVPLGPVVVCWHSRTLVKERSLGTRRQEQRV